MVKKKPQVIIITNTVHGGGAHKLAVSLNQILGEKYGSRLMVQEYWDDEANLPEGDIEVVNRRPYQRQDWFKSLFAVIRSARTAKLVISGMEGRQDLLAIIAAKIWRIPVFCWVHINVESNWRQKLSRRIAWKLADKVVFCSPDVRDTANFPVASSKSKVVWNGIDLAGFQAKAKAELPVGYDEVFQKPTVVTCARIEPVKDLGKLIRAHAKVVKEAPSHNLLVIGDGSQLENLKALARDLGLEGSVFFAGNHRNPGPFLSRSQIFAATSLLEGNPVAMIEAMSLGIPIISFDNPGSNCTLAGGEYGVVVHNRDVDVFADKLQELVASPELQSSWGQKSRERSQLFTHEQFAQRWLDLVGETLK